MRGKGPLCAHWFAGLLFQDNGEGPLRSTTGGGVRGGFGVPASLSGNWEGPLAQRGVVRVQLVPWRQRSSNRAVRSRYRRLQRRTASGPSQRKSGSGIHAVVPDVASGNASRRRKRRYGKKDLMQDAVVLGMNRNCRSPLL